MTPLSIATDGHLPNLNPLTLATDGHLGDAVVRITRSPPTKGKNERVTWIPPGVVEYPPEIKRRKLVKSAISVDREELRKKAKKRRRNKAIAMLLMSEFDV